MFFTLKLNDCVDKTCSRELADKTDNWYPKVGAKHTWQVYVISELKIKLFCFLFQAPLNEFS